jgi:hypothetical protein
VEEKKKIVSLLYPLKSVGQVTWLKFIGHVTWSADLHD